MNLSLTVCLRLMRSCKSCKLKLHKWTVSSRTTSHTRKPSETWKAQQIAALNRVASHLRFRRRMQQIAALKLHQGKPVKYRCATEWRRESSKSPSTLKQNKHSSSAILACTRVNRRRWAATRTCRQLLELQQWQRNSSHTLLHGLSHKSQKSTLTNSQWVSLIWAFLRKNLNFAISSTSLSTQTCKQQTFNSGKQSHKYATRKL